MARGRSIHIGLNYVDANAYGGWDGQLNGCVNDATGLKEVADALGYETTLITNGAATSYRVIGDIAASAEELEAGDIFWISYSGHGGQVQDSNGEEEDAMDETWVLFDREVIDDELHALWAQFASGVRIVVTSDSCHSGTVVKEKFAKELDRIRPRGARGTDPPRAKAMPRDVQTEINHRDKQMYDTLQWIAGSKSLGNVQASVVLISGCQDNQLSYDGDFYGQFTGTLIEVWDQGNFEGDYADFHHAILDRMPPYQTPNYFTVGAANQEFEDQKPFTIAPPGPSVSPAPPAQPTGPGTATSSQPTQPAWSTPPPSGTHDTLRRGDNGEEVLELQRLLVENGFHLTPDGKFGQRTESAVRQFQHDNGLHVDGVVGDATWQALEALNPS